MKPNKKVSDACGVIAIFVIFAGGVEGLDGDPTFWNLVCLVVAGVFGWISLKTEPKKNTAR